MLAEPRVQRRLGRRPGLRRLQRLRRRRPRRGRRPGRRRQDDARRHRLDPQGQGRRGQARSTARSASRSPTAPSAAASSSRARPTRASASASPAPTSCSAASPRSRSTTRRGCVVDRANAKGFAFEYMTSGRAVVLGDLGPWACAGMTGGRVYVRLNADSEPRPRGDRAPPRRGRQGRARGARRRGPCSTSRTCSATTRRAARHRPGRGGRARPRPRRAPAGELPDGRPAQGPGGPEHLDRVGVGEGARGPPRSNFSPVACGAGKITSRSTTACPHSSAAPRSRGRVGREWAPVERLVIVSAPQATAKI